MKNPNIMGIIQSIIRFVEAWLSLAAGMVVIFCITHMDAPTSIGRMMGEGSGRARSSHRNLLFRGITWWTGERPEYRCRARPASLSGVDGSVWMMDW